jgi:hypothetical protein
MIKKTKTRYTKKRHLKKRHLKKRSLKTRHLKSSYTRRLKRHSINKLNTLPGSQGVPVFSASTINPSNKIYIDSDHKESGNIIPGLRTYLGKNT